MRILTPLRMLAAALAIALAAVPASSFAQLYVGFTVGTPPPPLPIYAQPAAPLPNYMWTPGYWSWGSAGYYWVPGTWVAPPATGLYWTPGYWGAQGSGYGWNQGYWGPQVGFYGGINYGAGYYGNGYVGGVWRGSNFAYNTAVTRVNTTVIHNTYINRTVINRTVVNRVSYNGGRGGIVAHPTPAQRQAYQLRHTGLTSEQKMHEQAAAHDRDLLDNVNHEHPKTEAVAKPLKAPPTAHNEPTANDKKAAQVQMHPTAVHNPPPPPHSDAAPPAATGDKNKPPGHR